MEYRNFIGFEQVSCIFRRPGVYRASCVTDLIVGDDVDCSSYCKIWGFRKAKSLEDDSLGADSCITVDLQV